MINISCLTWLTNILINTYSHPIVSFLILNTALLCCWFIIQYVCFLPQPHCKIHWMLVVFIRLQVPTVICHVIKLTTALAVPSCTLDSWCPLLTLLPPWFLGPSWYTNRSALSLIHFFPKSFLSAALIVWFNILSHINSSATTNRCTFLTVSFLSVNLTETQWHPQINLSSLTSTVGNTIASFPE